ncbi:cytochrome ubiquinol oxidase subunit I [Bordetella holmesii]|uniref:Cytochrome ubiquinol oxidase n=2 Tax=Bordetella holmesii TaxID=35814 RepID=A0A158M3W6_9BORD|nr:cytochrome ubiquinol oxidase subunit I [Bordetella holmesii]AIT25007.1 bacterial Cytochrome Ubiquinol Oxidase family protein [Bordetella holmesii 44057]EWM48411.1 bacterial Cytochrome Ubiquinol Oxidase family protein [Bordetella holmesii 41130]AMD44262.1 transmembrane cytochrome oxidase [Bordetella holmesii H558]AOB36371.1 transmembrane cytochrome oxidase [Bordetella holmesii]AUL20339.1 cytochrome ubiquinol oxidase subunit I [Bordetella holmesii]
MNIAPLQLARTQFTASLSFLALFLAFSMALAWILLFFKLRARSGQPGWLAAYRFWVRIFALSFVLALVSAMPVLVQLASLWPGLMDKIGNVAGPLLGFGVLSVFILKSCFLGVMLFGQRQVSDLAHTLAVLMVAIGQVVAVGWAVSLQSWLQTPDGAAIVDGRYQVYDWVRVIFNPSFGWRMGLTVLGAMLAAAFLIMGVTALQALRRPLVGGERQAYKTALVIALAAALLQAPAAWGLGEVVARLQPAKAAALAGYWHSGTTPELVILGVPDTAAQRNQSALTLSNSGGRWLAQDADAEYIGLDKFSGMSPPVAMVFLALRALWLLGAMMFVAALFSFCLSFRRGYDPAAMPRWWLRMLTGMMFAGGVSVVLGVWVAQIGLQPYIVNRTITQSEVLSAVSASTLWWGLAGYGALYALLLSAFIGMLFHAARYGVVPVRKIGGKS